MTDRARNSIDHAIFWHVNPLGFVGAERCSIPGEEVHHRLDHLVAWLDYAIQLGASALLLGPLFASSTHGYDTIDHFRIDPRLGDEADFDRLIAEARRRGLHVVLDGVFDHSSLSRRFSKRCRLPGSSMVLPTRDRRCLRGPSVCHF